MSQCLNPNCLHLNPQSTQICEQCGAKLLLVDRYRAIKILGKGGFGRTFLAIDEFKPSKPRCVIKQFLPDVKGEKSLKKAAELFEREAMRLDELGKHEQIPELFAYFSQEERQYLIQEFIDGDDLAKELAQKGVFSEQQIQELLKDLLTVLKFVHVNNVIHRDIKPENIIRRKRDGKLVLVDFGAAKDTEAADLSVTGTIIGSAAYIAPEQAVGKPKFASDLYSLGATCLHLLTNIEPTELFDVAEGEWIWREYLRDNEIRYELSRVLDKLVEGATKRRFQSVEEVLHALDHQAPLPGIRQVASASSHRAYHQASIAKTQPTPLSVHKLDLKIFQFNFVTIALDQSIVVAKKPKLQTRHFRGKAKYITLKLSQDITMDLVGIPGGQFLMGSPENEPERGNDESPQHSVNIRPFLLGKYLVTQAQWQAVMKKNPARFIHPNRPVEKVSWYDCLEFCQKLSNLIGREFRLPTESEWEYACRGKTNTPFHFGTTITTDLANYNGEYSYEIEIQGKYRHETTEVGSFSSNSFGLYDMHGNLAEWCFDSWHPSYDNASIDGSAWTSNQEKDNRILRGGSWLHLPGCCRSSHRLSAAPNIKSDAFGFRIAASV
ncbi:serine/threonine protein kinase [Stanieria cyanosphaera PCC 7437]|uniref:Serine/threonine protein kinase n=1 Tax=Stanieria cyanosphaera (strain ATCC 29371 / PCC 7437) TaxID=111780 RepID=K9XUT9_STAC7|nr:bifunctional serine/threonine-protein kinase/formylglycine-generating enzyme family protein [Stanieria cyanosphaera]AFZ36303.1 serine/threonine protein kinase [Stanieria cyanosphaera PCC 7437]